MVSSISDAYNGDKMLFNMYNGLSFKKRTARIDWRKIASVDLDRVARELDVNTLQENIDNLTFCNIDCELDTKMIDPNYTKLFKMCQFTIEYLMHSQNYLTDVIFTIEQQLNKSINEMGDAKKSSEKLLKDYNNLKKDNKKRKKMIETQQTLINTNSSNYHQCAYCSKVFINISYLQAHMSRRHVGMAVPPMPLSQTSSGTDIDRELDRIKERLRNAEHELMQERSVRVNNHHSSTTLYSSTTTNGGDQKPRAQQDNSNEMARMRDNFVRATSELQERNESLERNVAHLQDKLGSMSHVGWMKDDIDLEKDLALKQRDEITRLKGLISGYEKRIEESMVKWKNKEIGMKQKFARDLADREEVIVNLRARLEELQHSVGKSDNDLLVRIDELQIDLQAEVNARYQCEKELAELKNRQPPPPVTPRQSFSIADRPVSPKPKQHQQQSDFIEIYLPDHCPLTLKAVQKNHNLLASLKSQTIESVIAELDPFGIRPDDKFLSINDYNLQMSNIMQVRRQISDELPTFSKLRDEFEAIADKHAQIQVQNLASSLKSAQLPPNRVTFKPDIKPAKQRDDHIRPSSHNPAPHKAPANLIHYDRNGHGDSEETNDEMSAMLSNALESNDDDEETERNRRNINNNPRQTSPRRTASNNSRNQQQPSSGSSVNDTRRKIEQQLEKSHQRGYKPTSNAVPVGFQSTASRIARQTNDDEDTFSSVSDMDVYNQSNSHRPKSGLRASLQDSQSSSVWVSESHSANDPHLNHNQQHRGSHEYERPATANSLKTSNLDSDEFDA